MGKKEIYFGVVLMALSAFFFGLTFLFPKQTLAMSPRLFPRVISAGLFILAAFLTIEGIRGIRQGQEIQEGKEDTPWIRFILLILIAFGYTRVLEIASYVVTTPFLIAGLMILFNEKRWYVIGTVSALTTVVLYVLFRIVFRVPLPRFEFF